MTAISKRLEQQYPRTNEGRGVELSPSNSKSSAICIARSSCCLSPVGFVLLIACANVANLMLARSSNRGAGNRDSRRARWQPSPARSPGADRTLVLAAAGGLFSGRDCHRVRQHRAPQDALDGQCAGVALERHHRHPAAVDQVSDRFARARCSPPRRRLKPDCMQPCAAVASREGRPDAPDQGRDLGGRRPQLPPSEPDEKCWTMADLSWRVLLVGAGLLVRSFVLLSSVPVGMTQITC